MVLSLILVTTQDNHAIKLRITTADLNDKSLHKFTAEFQKLVNEAKTKGKP